jgi:hypothetical protein
MSGPLCSSRSTSSEGKLDEERRRVPGLSDFIQENEPRLIAFNEYANQEGTEVKVVQVHPDTDSFEFHMGVVRERAEQAYAETLDATTSVQVYGSPSDGILEMLNSKRRGLALSASHRTI